MKLGNSVALYLKYLKAQADKLDMEEVAEKSESVCQMLYRLERSFETSEKWCDAVGYAICETVEYINLCVYKCRHYGAGNTVVIPSVIPVVAALCDLKHSIAAREGFDAARDDLMEQIGEFISEAGSAIRVQDEKYWFCISKIFQLDEDGAISAGFYEDVQLIAAREAVELVVEEDVEPAKKPRKELTFEEEALRVLREAMELPVQQVATSWVQRKFGYGYAKAVKLLDWLEERQYVQSYAAMQAEGLHGRRILVSKDIFDQ